MANNYRVALWADIEAATQQRIAENEARMASCTNPDVMILLRRINADDHRWLAEADEFIRWHRR